MPFTKKLSTALVLVLLALTMLLGCKNSPSDTTTYTVTFLAGTGGSLTGSTSQTVTSGGSTTAVTAVANTGFAFTNWTGSTTNTLAALTLTNVTSNMTITANFTATTATTLAYTDPVSTTTYLLKKNTTLSTPTHLVLDLVGPTGATGSGISASFTADTTKVAWTNVASTDASGTYVQNGTAFTLGAAPLIFKGKLTGSVLQVAAAQKGTASPVSLNAPLLRLALDLGSSVALGTITLSSDNTKALVLDSTGVLTPITISVGTLTAQ